MVKETKLYDILQVSTEAKDHEIRKAYKTLALKYHPDKQLFTNEEEREPITNQFKLVSDAYSILSDPNKRHLYDNYGEEIAKNPELQTQVFSTENYQYDHQYSQRYSDSHRRDFHAFPEQSFQFQTASNLFNQFFNNVHTSGLFNGMSSGPRNGGNSQNGGNFYNSAYQNQFNNTKLRKGRDIHDDVYCSLLDYYKGESFKLSLTRRIKCPKCKARGGLKIYTCNDCCGSGVIINETRFGMMFQRSESTCARCKGSGEVIPSTFICDNCGGNKLIDSKIILNFETPKGVSDGYRIVFPNAADEGIDLIPGDVIITLRDDRQKHNTKFKRSGNNLLTTISIPLVTVLCGGYIIFEHIDGEKVKIFISRGEIESCHQVKVLKHFGMPIHKQEASNSSKSKNYRQKNKKNQNDQCDSNFHLADETTTQNSGPHVVVPTDTSSSNDNYSFEYGDLYIRFEIKLPAVKEFSNQQVSILNKVFGLPFTESESSKESISAKSSAISSPDHDTQLWKASSIDENYAKQSILEEKAANFSNAKSAELLSGDLFTAKDSTISQKAAIDNQGYKIVFLEDLRNNDTVGLSHMDFPEVFDEKTAYRKNSNMNSSSERHRTAEIIDGSFSDLKPHQKKAKTQSFI